MDLSVVRWVVTHSDAQVHDSELQVLSSFSREEINKLLHGLLRRFLLTQHLTDSRGGRVTIHCTRNRHHRCIELCMFA